PETADEKTMGNTFIFHVETADRPVAFKAPAYAYDITKMEFMKWIDKKENFRRIGPHGFDWTFEYGGQLDVIKNAEDIDKELRCLTMGIWDYVKNSGKFPEADNRRLVSVCCKSGSRESRRIIGEYMLTENDIEAKKDFPDAVAIGGWPMDVHAPLGIYDPNPASNFIPVTGIYNIPLRCLYSKDIGNLFMAGRDAGFTHIALGSARVIATCGCMGQAVGTAAVICNKYGILPREAVRNPAYMEEIQSLLMWDDQTILHRKDSELSGFSASADSQRAYENTEKDGEMLLERAYGLALMCQTDSLCSLEVKLRVERDTVLTVDCLSGVHPETYLPEFLDKTLSIPLKKQEGWVTLPLNAQRGQDGKVYLVFRQNPDITLFTSRYQPIGAVTHRYHTEASHDNKNHDTIPLPHQKVGEYIGIDRTYEEKKNILFRNILPPQSPYEASSAVNGYSRPYGNPNLWQPASLPATLTLTAGKPQKAKEVALVFNTRMETDEDFHSRLPFCQVKDFTLTVTYSDGKTQSWEERDNVLRQRVFPLSGEVVKMEITLQSSYGELPGIFAVKLR
ncbi:MAG: FAD-dependent oxidoreductase, partial [Clostridia bacterium]|nr:FAD-dependent oxidoreductase [Clostridia bacterium]